MIQVDRLNLKTVVQRTPLPKAFLLNGETVNTDCFIPILTRFKSGENKKAKLFLNRFNGFFRATG